MTCITEIEGKAIRNLLYGFFDIRYFEHTSSNMTIPTYLDTSVLGILIDIFVQIIFSEYA